VLRDLRFGLRLLARHPGQTAAAVLALGLGIGLSTAMFSIVYGAVLRSLPFPDPGRLLFVETIDPSRYHGSHAVDAHDFLALRRRQTTFAGFAAFAPDTVILSGDAAPERYAGAGLSADLLAVLQVRPRLGRGFLPGEDVAGAPAVVLIGDELWHRRYGGDPRVLGRAVRVDGEPGTIVGVMPPGFGFPDEQEVWLPLRLAANPRRGDGTDLKVIGRLRAGATLERARAELATLARALVAEHPETRGKLRAVVRPYREEAIGASIVSLLSIMLGACLAVLCIACVNVASLTMARAALRGREIAVRAALGASRRAIAVQMLVENLLLSVLGALLGLLLARWGVGLFNAAIADVNPPYWLHIALDPAVFLFALGLAVLAGLLSGLLPALQASRPDLTAVLKDEGRGSPGLRLGRFSRAVVVFEVAASYCLLVGAGLMIHNVINLERVDLGFDAGRLFTCRLALFDATYPRREDRVRFLDALLGRLQAQPDVVAAAVTSNLPTGASNRQRYAVAGRTYPRDEDVPTARVAAVSPGFFATFGAPVLQGRGFVRTDTAEGPPVVLVNRSFAAAAWPGQDPVGRRLRLLDGPGPEPWRAVVGVVPDLRMAGINERDQSPQGLYLPLAQRCPNFVSVAVRTRVEDPTAIAGVVRQQVAALDPDLPIYFVYSMTGLIAESSFFLHLFGTLFAICGACALLLGAVGIYGVLVLSVHRRVHEIGIRMALGAPRATVVRLVLRQGMRQLLLGLAGGLLLASGVAWLLGRFLIGVRPDDPLTFGGVALVLAAIALLACWLPARRAAATEPAVAVRRA
jgi:putative ABC transport system permease protein